jgi:hypothetical protein
MVMDSTIRFPRCSATKNDRSYLGLRARIGCQRIKEALGAQEVYVGTFMCTLKGVAVARNPRTLRRSIVRYAFATASLITIIVGIVLILTDPRLTIESIASSLGVNLIASVVFATAFALVSERAQEQALEENLNESFDRLAERLIDQVAQVNQLFVPTAVYPESDTSGGFQDGFNRDLTRSLSRTRSYFFRGSRAWYMAARLLTVRHKPQLVRLAILDPRNSRAVAKWVSDRMGREENRGLDRIEIEQKFLESIAIAVVAVFDCRHICDIHILYDDNTSAYRYELTDDSAFISWVHSSSSAGRAYPIAFRFPQDSFVYQSLHLEIGRMFEMSTRKYVFSSEQNDDYVLAHLAELLNRAVSIEDLTRWRSQYRTRIGGFYAYIDAVSARVDQSH